MQNKESTEDQIRRCRYFAKIKDWEVLTDHIYKKMKLYQEPLHWVEMLFNLMIENAKIELP